MKAISWFGGNSSSLLCFLKPRLSQLLSLSSILLFLPITGKSKANQNGLLAFNLFIQWLITSTWRQATFEMTFPKSIPPTCFALLFKLFYKYTRG